jgi:ethanolamine ammonia-lyase large subunit
MATPTPPGDTPSRVSIPDVKSGEDLFTWLDRVHGGYDVVKYRQILGAANPYKEGDDAQGLAARDEPSRENSRRLIANTTIRSILAHPIYDDEVVIFADVEVDAVARRRIDRRSASSRGSCSTSARTRSGPSCRASRAM